MQFEAIDCRDNYKYDNPIVETEDQQNGYLLQSFFYDI